MNKILLIIIIANVLVSLKGFSDRSFFEKYKFSIGGIKNGEFLRHFSSGFLHADYMHLFFNMYALYLFAPIVIKSFNAVFFGLIYVACLGFSSLYSYYYHKNDNNYSAVGASGAVAGIVYSSILLHPNMTLYMFPLPIPIPGYIFGIGYIIYSIYGMKNQFGNIGHSAHLSGAITGYILTLILAPSIIIVHPWLVFGLAIPIVVLFLFPKKL